MSGISETLERKIAEEWGIKRWRSSSALLANKDDGVVGILREKGLWGAYAQRRTLEGLIEQEDIAELTLAINKREIADNEYEEGYTAVVKGGRGTTVQIDYSHETQLYRIKRWGTFLNKPAREWVSKLEAEQPKPKTEEVEIPVKKGNELVKKQIGEEHAGWRDGSTTEGIGVLVYALETGYAMSIRHKRQKPLSYNVPTIEMYFQRWYERKAAAKIRQEITASLSESFPNMKERTAIACGEPVQFTIYFSGYRSNGIAHDASLAQAYRDAVKHGIFAIFQNIAEVYKRKEEPMQRTELVAK